MVPMGREASVSQWGWTRRSDEVIRSGTKESSPWYGSSAAIGLVKKEWRVLGDQNASGNENLRIGLTARQGGRDFSG